MIVSGDPEGSEEGEIEEGVVAADDNDDGGATAFIDEDGASNDELIASGRKEENRKSVMLTLLGLPCYVFGVCKYAN